MEATRRVYVAGVERRDAVAQEKRALAAGLVQTVPPSWPAFILFYQLDLDRCRRVDICRASVLGRGSRLDFRCRHDLVPGSGEARCNPGRTGRRLFGPPRFL